MRYDIWDRETGHWRGEYATVDSAIRAALKAAAVVTERTPLGDPRISLVEDAATGYFRNRPTTQRDYKWVSEAGKRLREAKANWGNLPQLTREIGDREW